MHDPMLVVDAVGEEALQQRQRFGPGFDVAGRIHACLSRFGLPL
jgi:hypothetical protein